MNEELPQRGHVTVTQQTVHRHFITDPIPSAFAVGATTKRERRGKGFKNSGGNVYTSINMIPIKSQHIAPADDAGCGQYHSRADRLIGSCNAGVVKGGSRRPRHVIHT